jgi:hypothetical protein
VLSAAATIALLAFPAASAAGAVPDGHAAARTADGSRVVLTIRDGAVVRARVTVGRYRCETFGDLGPVRADERGHARIGRAGRFAFAAGEPARRVLVRGRVARDGRARGLLRVRGTIATGQRCSSPRLRFG